MTAGIQLYSSRVRPRMRTMAMKRGIERVVFQLRPLKLGYWKRLNIMNERKIRRAGRSHFQRPRSRSLRAIQSMKRVSDAVRPAAAGMGKPRNSFEAELG